MPSRFATAATESTLPADATLSKAAIYGLLFAAMTSTWGGIVLPFGTIADLAIMVPTAIVGLSIIGGFRFTLRFWLWIPPIAIVICMTIRYLIPAPYYILVTRYQLTPYAPNNFGKGFVWIIALLLVPILVIACTNWEPRVPQWIAAAYVVGTSCSSLVAVTDLLGVTALSESFGTGNYTSRQSGLSVHANMLGFTALLSIPLAFYLLTTVKRKLFVLPAVPLIFAGVVLSGSRAAQVASLVVVILCTLMSPNKQAIFRQLVRIFAVVGVTALIASIILKPQVLKDVFRVGDSHETVGSDTSRLLLAKEALRDIEHYPVLGLGLKHIVEAHNIYLQLFAAGGILLAIPVLFYWGFILRDCLLLRRLQVPMAPFLGIYMIIWLTVGVVENQLTDRLLYYQVGCVAALASTYLTTRLNKDEIFSDLALVGRS